MRIRTQCHACGLPFTSRLSLGDDDLACPGCDDRRPVATIGWQAGAGGRIDICPLCDCRHLYRQRDVNRGLACLTVALGALAAPWTFGLSLGVVLAADLWLYHRLPPVVVCYRCDTVYRDARPHERQGEFNLLKHDVLKFGKTWATEEEGAAAAVRNAPRSSWLRRLLGAP